MGNSFQSPQKKFQRYRPINEILQAIFVFGFMIMGKELLTDLKYGIFKSWLGSRPKMAKVPVFKCQKINGTSSAQIFERTPKTPRNTPQNGGVDIWIMHFHFRASMKPNFENCYFSSARSSFPIIINPNTKIVLIMSFMGL